MDNFFILLTIILCSCFSLYGIGNSDDSTDTLKPNIHITKDSADSSHQSQYNQYNTFVWAVRQHLIIYDKAREMGYATSTEDINERLEVYKRAFPDVKIDVNLIKRELIIEKYFQEKGEYSIDDYQLQNVYSDYIKSCSSEPAPSFETLEPILRSKALFTSDYLVEKTRQELEELYYQHQERRAKAKKPWPLKKLRIDGPENKCLVSLIENNSCLVTVGEFNNALLFNKQPNRYPLDTARIRVLRKLLRDIYYAEQARFTGVSEKNNIEEKINRWHERRYLREQFKTLGMGKPVLDKNVLWEVYKTYYDQLFCIYDKVTLDIIGSTDSLWIDSIYQKVVNIKNKDLSDGKKDIEKKKKDSIPWIQTDTEKLPVIVVSPTDTLLEGELTPPIKTPFGYFICRVAKVEKIKSIAFPEAKIQCIYIATRDKYLNIMDSSIESKAYNYYKKHQAHYISPDTMIIQAWLIPGTDTDTFNNNQKAELASNCRADTLSFRSIMTTSLSLPEEVRLELEKQYRRIKDKSNFIGLIKGKFGKWCIKIKNEKTGGKPIPFRLVKNDIIDILYEPYLKMDSDSLNEELERLKLESGLAREYLRYKSNEIEKLSDKEVQALIDKGEIDTTTFEPGMPDEYKFDHAREILNTQLFGKNKETIREWIASVNIDKELLFQKEKNNYTAMQK